MNMVLLAVGAIFVNNILLAQYLGNCPFCGVSKKLGTAGGMGLAVIFVAVLAYAIGNQTISQRLFAVNEDHIKPTFITATVGYGAIVIGLGMIGLMALTLGVEPLNGDMNNLIPQMVSEYLPPFFIALFFMATRNQVQAKKSK